MQAEEVPDPEEYKAVADGNGQSKHNEWKPKRCLKYRRNHERKVLDILPV